MLNWKKKYAEMNGGEHFISAIIFILFIVRFRLSAVSSFYSLLPSLFLSVGLSRILGIIFLF
jgi:hypothetical protein